MTSIHGFVLERGVDASQPVGPQFVAIGPQNFEQTPFALSTLNHARSFEKRSRAGSLVRQIDRGNPEWGISSRLAAGHPYNSATYTIISSPRSSLGVRIRHQCA
jgi:hypothetical protein